MLWHKKLRKQKQVRKQKHWKGAGIQFSHHLLDLRKQRNGNWQWILKYPTKIEVCFQPFLLSPPSRGIHWRPGVAFAGTAQEWQQGGSCSSLPHVPAGSSPEATTLGTLTASHTETSSFLNTHGLGSLSQTRHLLTKANTIKKKVIKGEKKPLKPTQHYFVAFYPNKCC